MFLKNNSNLFSKKNLKLLTLSQKSTCFTCPLYKSFENIVRNAELPIMSNFSFSHSVFYSFVDPTDIFIKFKIVVCKLTLRFKRA